MKIAYRNVTPVLAGCLISLSALGCTSGTPLFNGKNLDGWVEIGSTGAWRVADETLICNGEKDGYAWLCTERRYGDFELSLEWKIEPGGNSGVFLRVPEQQGRASMTGLEIQCRDDNDDADLTDVAGAVFRRIPASGRYARPPGQWNKLEVVFVGRELSIELNEHDVSEGNIDAVAPRDDDPPMNEIPNVGYIGLQNHGDPVAFRRIVIREQPGGPVPSEDR